MWVKEQGSGGKRARREDLKMSWISDILSGGDDDSTATERENDGNDSAGSGNW